MWILTSALSVQECHLKGLIREMLKQKVQMNELQEQHIKPV